jgi:hypothetical protein
MLFECKLSMRPVGLSVIDEVKRKVRFLGAPRSHTIERVLICGGEITASHKRNDYFHHIVPIDGLFT